MERVSARSPSSRSSGGSYGSAYTPSRGARSQSSHSNGTARRRSAGSNSGRHMSPASSEMLGCSAEQRLSPGAAQGVWSDPSLIRAVDAIGVERNERGAADAAAEPSVGQLNTSERKQHAAEEKGNAPADLHCEAQGEGLRAAPGEEFIVSPSPLAIALGSERDGRQLAVIPAAESASAAEVSNRGLSRDQQQSSHGARRARSLQEARPVRGGSETFSGAQQRGAFSERPSVLDRQHASALLRSSFFRSSSHTRTAMSDTAATSSQSGVSVSFAPLAAHQNQGQQQAVPQLQGSSEENQASLAVVHGEVPFPPILRDWVMKPDAEAVLSKILTLASARLQSVDELAVHFEADDEESLQEAQQDLLRHLGHKASIVEKRKVKEEVERIQQEFREGLRCELKVPLDALPYVLGPQGSNVAQVQAECGLDRLIASPQDGTVRIAGRRKEDVDRARSLLEFDVRRFPLTRDVCESSGDLLEALLTKVRTKSKVAAAELRDDEQGLAVLLVGRKPAVEEGARVVTAQLQVLEELQAEAAEVADVSEELQQISRAWGQEGTQAPALCYARSSGPMRVSTAQQAAAPVSAGTPPVAREAGWEDIEPPRLEAELGEMGAHTEASSWAEVPALETAGGEHATVRMGQLHSQLAGHVLASSMSAQQEDARGVGKNHKRTASGAAEGTRQNRGPRGKEGTLTATGWEGVMEAPAAGKSPSGNGHAEGSEVSGEFTLTSPPAPQREDSHTSAWDAAWPSSAVSGRTQWAQQARAESKPGEAAQAAAASHFMIELPKTSVVSDRAREERWPVEEDRSVEEGPREVINTRRVAPPDLSTFLRTPSGKPSSAASLPAASAARSHETDLRPTMSESREYPQARSAQQKGPAPSNVTGNEGSHTGRVSSNSAPQIDLMSTVDTQVVSQPLPSEAASVVVSRRVDPASRARSAPGSFTRRDVRRETLSARPAGGSLSWAESSVSSTNSTSTSKLAHREGSSAAPRNLPAGVSQDMLPEEATHEQPGKRSQDSGEHPQEASLPEHDVKSQFEAAGEEESPRKGEVAFEAHTQDVEDECREGASLSVDTGSASVESVQGSQAGVAEVRAAEMEVQGQLLPSEEAAETIEAYAERAESLDNDPRGVGLVDEMEAAAGAAACSSKETIEPNEGEMAAPCVAAAGQAEGRSDAQGFVSEAGSDEKREERVLEWAEQTGPQHAGQPSESHEQPLVVEHQKKDGEEEATGWAHSAAANEEATGWANGHLAQDRDATPAPAIESGWQDAPVQPWSDETPVRAKKATPSGSWVSEDSGSVRSVGIDVGQWVEEAAEKALQEDLDHCPAPFEGASDTRSGRGGSSSSGRGSSEGGRRERACGPYRLKMQKYQLQAIKANQRGGGDPTGWQALLEEDTGGEAGILPTPTVQAEAPPPVPSPAPTAPSFARSAEQAPPEWTQHKQRQGQHAPPLPAADTRRSSHTSAHALDPPAPPADAPPPAAEQEVHPGPAEDSHVPAVAVATGPGEVAPTGWAGEGSAAEGPLIGHRLSEEKEERYVPANGGWTEDATAPRANEAQRQMPTSGRGRPDRRASTGESERRRNKRGGRQQREKHERAMAERQAGVGVLGSGRRAVPQEEGPGRARSGGSAGPHDVAGAAQPTGWTDAAPASAATEQAFSQQHWAPPPAPAPAPGNRERGEDVSQGRRHLPAAHGIPVVQQRAAKRVPVPSVAQDIRVLEGVLPPAVLKRSMAIAAPLLPMPTAEQRSVPAVQGARFPLERQHEESLTSQGRDKRRGSREVSPQEASEPRAVAGQESARGGEVSPSEVPPSGWTEAELSPASILHPLEQASPGGRSGNSKGRNADRGKTAARSNMGYASEGTMTSAGHAAKQRSGSGMGQPGAGSYLAGPPCQGSNSQGNGTWGTDATVDAAGAEMGRTASLESGRAKERVVQARPSGVWSVRSRHETSVSSS